jgi:acetyltransferase
MRELFEPASVAVIGASPDRTKVGNIILGNMIESGFQGPLYPVNPRYDEVMGLRCYPRVTDVPGPVEMAVIVVPAKAVLQVMEECGQKGVRAVVVISAGFKEVGLEGAMLERRLGELAHQYGMRVLGPNCLGLVNTHHRMNATFAKEGPQEGNIAISSWTGRRTSTSGSPSSSASGTSWTWTRGISWNTFARTPSPRSSACT